MGCRSPRALPLLAFGAQVPLAASSPTLFPEAIRSLRPHSRAAPGIPSSCLSSEASQHVSFKRSYRLSAIPGRDFAAIRNPCRLSPWSAPLSGTFAMDYGSDLLPLMNALLLQAVDPVFRTHCFSKETCGCCHVRGRLFPHLLVRFRCTDVLWPLVAR